MSDLETFQYAFSHFSHILNPRLARFLKLEATQKRIPVRCLRHKAVAFPIAFHWQAHKGGHPDRLLFSS